MFFCICAGAKTGAACICTEMNLSQEFGKLFRKYFLKCGFLYSHECGARVCANSNSQDLFAACIGFGPGSTGKKQQKRSERLEALSATAKREGEREDERERERERETEREEGRASSFMGRRSQASSSAGKYHAML